MITLNSAFLSLTVDPLNRCYSLKPVDCHLPTLNKAGMVIEFHDVGGRYRALTRSWQVVKTSGPYHDELSSGPANRLDLSLKTSLKGIQIDLSFALLENAPLALIRMGFSNEGILPINLDRFTVCNMAGTDITLTDNDPLKPVFYSNGWQSWSSSGSYTQGQKQHRTHLGFLQKPMINYPGTPTPKKANHFTSDMFAVLADQTSRKGLVAGYLSQKQHFGSVEAHFKPELSLKMWANGDNARLEPDMHIQTDWAALSFINLDNPDPLEHYLDAVNLENEVRLPEEVPVGWCSWYYFFTNVSADDIRANLKTLVDLKEDLPLPLLQIDDGFEKKVGDWFDFNARFPDGVKPLADEIKAQGIIPGLWLAPFIVQSGAQLIKDHPDWFLRNTAGLKVNAGFGWNGLTAALDLTHPDALAYACQVIRKAVHEWGFPYLKLDFLYAAALGKSYRDPTKTRAQVMRMGLEAIRKAAGPETNLLACGCPLGSALGLFDTMRISADVSPSWTPEFLGISSIVHQEPSMPSARNAIQNILSRSFLDRRWWGNDPDCLLLRSDTRLTLDEVHSLATVIAMTGGAMLLSDNLPALPVERLAIAKILIPGIQAKPRVLDLFDKSTPEKVRLDLSGPAGDWQLLADFNWQDKPADRRIDASGWGLDPIKAYIGRELWTGEIINMVGEHRFKAVPSHGTRLFALRPFDPDLPCYIGSDLHISQGLELIEWQSKDDQLDFTLSLPRKVRGHLYLWLPDFPSHVLQDGNRIDVYEVHDNIFMISVSFNQTTGISIFLG